MIRSRSRQAHYGDSSGRLESTGLQAFAARPSSSSMRTNECAPQADAVHIYRTESERLRFQRRFCLCDPALTSLALFHGWREKHRFTPLHRGVLLGNGLFWMGFSLNAPHRRAFIAPFRLVSVKACVVRHSPVFSGVQF